MPTIGMPLLNRAPFAVALLLTLPILAIGLLAVHALSAEDVVLRSRQAEAALNVARRVGATAGALVQGIGEAAMDRAAAAAGRPEALHPEALHGIEIAGDIALVALYRDGQRVFPAEDPAMLLVTERQGLARAAGALAAARAELASAPDGWAGVPAGDGTDVLSCRRAGGAAEVCVLLAAAPLRQALAARLDALPPQGEGAALALLDPSGRPVWSRGPIAVNPAVVLPLDGALQGWRAVVGPGAAAPDSPRAVLVRAILIQALPSLAVLMAWLWLAWRLHRSQWLSLAESRDRAQIAAELLHDLRAPLANLRLYAGLIQRRVREAEAVRDFSAVIDAEAGRLDGFITNAVTYARGGAPRTDAKAGGVPDDVVGDIVERLSPLCEAAGCAVRFSGGAPQPARFDRAAVEQIVTNLLDNARKYAAGAPIEVTTAIAAEDKRHWLVLAVRDHGPGVPPEQRQHLFQSGQGRGGGGGFGLGLAAVRRLAQAGGGTVGVEDAGPGARFTARIALTLLDGSWDGPEDQPCAS